MKPFKITLAYRPEFFSHIELLNNYVDAYELMPEHFVFDDLEVPELLKEKELIAHTFQLCAGNEVLFKDRALKIKNWINQNKIKMISDHLAANFINGIEIDNFYPLDMSEVSTLNDNLSLLENFFGEIVLENPAVPFFLGGDFKDEALLLSSLYSNRRVQILLDINNLYINSKNFNFNPIDYFELLPSNSVKAFHLAGFDEHEDWLIDGHMSKIDNEVWKLCDLGLKKFSPSYVVLERDHFKGDIQDLIDELEVIRSFK